MLVLALVLHAGAPNVLSGQDDNPLKGAWILERVQYPDGAVLVDPEPALVLFTKSHFSFLMTVPFDQERVTYSGANPTDAEKVEAYESIDGGSGWYAVQGDSIASRAYLHLDPNAMNAWPDRVRKYWYRVEGDTLYWRFQHGTGVFRNVDGDKPPY